MVEPRFRPADVDASWLTGVLQRAGVADGTVAAVDADHIGAGKVGDNVRFTLTWAPGGSGPDTVVGKFPAEDPMSRSAGVNLGNYEREVRFYRELAGELDVRIPRCYLAVLDDTTGDFVLVMDDLHPACAGDQLTGCGPDDAASAIGELVGLHAPLWGDAGLSGRGAWLSPRLVDGGQPIADIYRALLPGFTERYAGRLDATTCAVTEAFAGVVGLWAEPGQSWSPSEAVVTVTHNDFRLDNLLFDHDPTDGRRRTAVVDWQTVGLGPGVADVSYLLGSGLLCDDRRGCERDLVGGYTQMLQAAGIDVSADDLWAEYRRTCPAGLVMAVLASSVVGAGERSDDMFLAMANRHATQMDDLGVIAEITSRTRSLQ